MSIVLTAAPAVEPVTLAEAKTHLRIDHDTEDAYIASLIVTSRLQIEAALGLALVTQSWRYTIDAWPTSGTLELPMRPGQSIEAIEIAHPSGTATALDPTAYLLDGDTNPARIALLTLSPPLPELPIGGITISFTAGFGATAAAVPAPIRQALRLLVAHWFECREPSTAETTPKPIPDAVNALLAPYRTVRL